MSNHETRRQGIFWLLTIPKQDWAPPETLPDWCSWIKGQEEKGNHTGYYHWQVIVAFKSKRSLRQVKSLFGRTAHCELSRSDAADGYVWKEDTRVEGTQFELGAKPIRRNSKVDWELVWTAAKSGKMEPIPAHIRVQSFRTLQSIAAAYAPVLGMERTTFVFWGRTGTGKSRRAWEEAGEGAYSKDPRSKFWDGYDDQQHVVIDEFRGGIDVSHLLRWTDRYPVRVEVKGSSKPLVCTKLWITSNVPPQKWYPDLDEETLSAVMRRLIIEEFS